jgi:nitrate reductase NapAB chaperone NapD
MGDNIPDAREVENALNNNLNNVEVENSDHAGGLRVSAHPAEAGRFFETLREEGIEFDASRVGGHIVAHIEANKQDTLADLFR